MRYIFLIILATSCFLPLNAQNTARKDTVLNRELTLEREYNPTIRDAVKISQFPELREPQTIKTNVEYSNYEIPYSVKIKLVPLNPESYLTNVNSSKYRGYLTGGVSSLIDIDGDLGYQILKSEKDKLNIFLSHRSSRSDIAYIQKVSDLVEDKDNKFKINDNWGGLNYTHDFSKIKFLLDAKYTYSEFNYYGLSIPYLTNLPGPVPNNNFDKSINQINQMFEANIGLSSQKDKDFKYKINIGYTNFMQYYGNMPIENGTNENRILINGDINKMIFSNVGLGLSGSAKAYSYPDEFRAINDSTTNYFVYSVSPYIKWENYYLNLILGLKMDVELNGLEKIVASPLVRLNFYPTEQIMLYLFAEGGRKDNSQYNLFYENRYIDPLIRVMDSRSPLDATIGIKFSPISTMSAGIFGGYKITQDEYFLYPNFGYKNHFIKDTPMLAGNWITPVYEDANTLKAGANFKYAFQNIFELSLKGTYYQWTISKEKYMFNRDIHQAWNKPSIEVNMNASYRMPWLPFRFDLSYIGAYGRKAASDSFFSTIINMNDIHDLSFKTTCSFTSNFLAYITLNNLLFTKYDFWYGYPAQGFNIMGGLSILF